MRGQFAILAFSGGAGECDLSCLPKILFLTVYSTPEGIDLRDESGASCLVHKGALGSDSPVTFPIYRLAHSQSNLELGHNLLRLWEQETCLVWKNIVTASSSHSHGTGEVGHGAFLPTASFGGECLELIRLNWKGSRLLPYKSPPRPVGETWLLWQCLRENWPTGGTLFIGDPAKWPARTDNIWVHFQRFAPQCIRHTVPYVF